MPELEDEIVEVLESELDESQQEGIPATAVVVSEGGKSDDDDDDEDESDEDEDEDLDEESCITKTKDLLAEEIIAEGASDKDKAKKLKNIQDAIARHQDLMKDASPEAKKVHREFIAKLNAKKTKLSESVEDMTNDDFRLLTEADESLSEEFKAKAATIFEAVVTKKLREEKLRLDEEANQRVEQNKQEVFESLADKLDKYVTEAVETWMADNVLAIESGLRTEIAESFMQSMKTVFVEHYVEVPDSKRDLVEELETKVQSAEAKLKTVEEEADRLKASVVTMTRERVLNEATENMVDTQRARVEELVKDVEFVSEEVFTTKVKTIVESLASSKPTATTKSSEEILISESNADEDPYEKARMEAIKKTLSRMKSPGEVSFSS